MPRELARWPGNRGRLSRCPAARASMLTTSVKSAAAPRSWICMLQFGKHFRRGEFAQVVDVALSQAACRRMKMTFRVTQEGSRCRSRPARPIAACCRGGMPARCIQAATAGRDDAAAAAVGCGCAEPISGQRHRPPAAELPRNRLQMAHWPAVRCARLPRTSDR